MEKNALIEDFKLDLTQIASKLELSTTEALYFSHQEQSRLEERLEDLKSFLAEYEESIEGIKNRNAIFDQIRNYIDSNNHYILTVIFDEYEQRKLSKSSKNFRDSFDALRFRISTKKSEIGEQLSLIESCKERRTETIECKANALVILELLNAHLIKI